MQAQLRTVDQAQWFDLLEWIHIELQAMELQSIHAELVRRSLQFPTAPQPMEVIENGKRVAGAYLTLVPGKVASVGGVRALRANFEYGSRLVNHLVQHASAVGATQIQAIVDPALSDAREILQVAGFTNLATLKHLWLGLSQPDFGNTNQFPSSRLVLTHVSMFERNQLEQLIAETFKHTLDCPAINHLRNPQSVLETFLDGRNLSREIPWWVLQESSREIGCLFLNLHAEDVAELVYVGLIERARGLGLGRFLVTTACGRATSLGCNVLVAAVDQLNQPAVRIYDQLGFHEHRTLEAWFRV